MEYEDGGDIYLEEFDLFEDGDYYEEPDKVSHEGGDFHLKSALREHKDLMKNQIYRKEYIKLSRMYSVGEHNMFNQIDIMILLIKTLHVDTTRKVGLYGDLWRNGMFRNQNHLLSSMVHAESSCLSEAFGRYHGVQSLNMFIDDVTHLFNDMIIKETLYMCILTLKNSLKNLILTDVVGFPEYPSISIREEGVADVSLMDGVNLHVGSDQIIFEVNGSMIWTPMSYFQNALDKLSERLNIFLYSAFMEKFQVPGVPSLYKVTAIINLGDSILDILGNEGYNTLATYEALVVGVILSRDDPGLVNEPCQFLEDTIAEAHPDVKDEIMKMVSILKTCREDELADLHGLYRIWGHPIVDIEGGLRKYLEVQKKPEDICTVARGEIGRKFKELFLMGYHRLHGFYPEIQTTSPEERISYIVRCLTKGVKINKRHIGYVYADWDLVTLKTCFAIPFSWNLVHDTKDKAVSPTRQELYESVQSRNSVFSTKNRRGVLKMINTPMEPMREYLTKVSRDGMPANDLIIGVYPKERELKIKARLFSLMSFRLRQYFVATEGLLGEKMLPYFPQITMSTSMLDMLKMMGSLTKSMGDDIETVTYVINMDFIKWNLQMIYETCTDVFKRFDELFGIHGLYDNTHIFLKQCVMFLCSGEGQFTPDPHTGVSLDGLYAWNEDGRGREGLRQKGWTIVTVCALLYVIDKYDVRGELIGGGDNQVFILKIPGVSRTRDGCLTGGSKQIIRETLKRIMEDLTCFLSKLGLPLKRAETWASHNLFMYNKHMYYRGVPLRSVLKTISRAFIFSNNSTMLLSNMIDGVSTSIKTAMAKEKIPVGLIFMKNYRILQAALMSKKFHPLLFQFEGSLALSRGVIIRQGRKKVISISPSDQLVEDRYNLTCLMLPSILGGPGPLNCLSMILRGFPDPLSEGLAYLNMMADVWEGSERIKRWIIEMRGASRGRRVEYAKLVEDPASVNHDAPTHGMNELRQLSRDALLKMKSGINSQFYELFTLLDRRKESSFYNSLCSNRVVDPRVLHEVAGASLFGYVNGMASRIDQTKTIMKISTRVDVVKKIARAEMDYISYLHVRDHYAHEIQGINCSRVMAQMIRNHTWMREIIGVTVPHPYEYICIMDEELHVCDLDTAIIRTDTAVGDVLMSTSGEGRVYLGSYTKERFKQTEIAAAYGNEDLLRRAIDLIKLVNWRYMEGSTYAEILKGPLRAVSNVDPSLFVRQPDEIRGDYEHRGRIAGDTMRGGVSNFLASYTSHFTTCTSTWRSHARGGTNENIHFQALMIRSNYEILLKRWLSVIPRSAVYHLHEKCGTCIAELMDPKHDNSAPLEQINLPTMPHNPYVYIHKENIRTDYSIKRMIEESIAVNISPISPSDVDLPVLTAAMQLILDVIGETPLPESYILIMREKVPLEKTMDLLLTLLHVMGNSPMFRSFTIRRLSNLSTFLNKDEGVRYLFRRLSYAPGGSLEGGIVLSSTMLNALLARRVKEPKVLINAFMGKVKYQTLIYIYINDPLVLTCKGCQESVEDRFNRALLNPHIPWRCMPHLSANCSTPPVISVHPEHLIKTAEDLNNVELHVPFISDLYTLERLTTEGYGSTVLANYAITSVYKPDDAYLCTKEMVKSIICSNLNKQWRFITTGDIQDIGPCLQAMMEIRGHHAEIILYTHRFSGSECRSVYDSGLFKTYRAYLNYRGFIDKVNELDDGVILPCSVSDVVNNTFSRLDMIVYIWELSGLDTERGFSFWMLDKRVSEGVTIYLTEGDQRIDNAVINGAINKIQSQPLDLQVHNDSRLSEKYWPIPCRRTLSSRVYHAWMLWSDRYSLIKVVGILKRKIVQHMGLTRRKLMIKAVERLLISFIASLLAHAPDIEPEIVGSISCAHYSPASDSITLTRDDGYHLSIVQNWIWYKSHFSGHQMHVDYASVLTKINLSRQSYQGFNCVGARS
ncbi:TPA_asm: L [Agave tequilana virus 1]|uniref:RNA-directed RNA polymerase n=1 Tax=Agave tequilana virus 1 TaxID=2793719 RepID=A0A8D9PGS6_9RHAB|nr:L [Agave tequilana virus 1] [Agave tequilana virus 1]DAF42283.1 TPA_asm: L [Agave tequilana virus 1]